MFKFFFFVLSLFAISHASLANDAVSEQARYSNVSLIKSFQQLKNDYQTLDEFKLEKWLEIYESRRKEQPLTNLHLYSLFEIITYHAQQQNRFDFDFWVKKLEKYQDKASSDSQVALRFYVQLAQFKYLYFGNNDQKALALASTIIEPYQYQFQYVDETKLASQSLVISAVEYGELINSAGYSYFITDEYTKAQVLFAKARTIFDSAGNLKGKAKALNNLSLIAWAQNDYDAALSFLAKSIEQSEKLGDHKEYLRGLTNQGLYFKEKKAYNLALNSFTKSLANPAIDNFLRIKSNTLIGLADTYIELNQSGKAELAINEGLSIARFLQDESLIMSAIGTQGNLRHIQKRYSESIQLQSQALVYYEAQNMRRPQALYHEWLSQSYDKMGEFDKALEHFKQYHQINIELKQEAQSYSVNKLKAEYEADEQSKKIELLKAENQIKETKLTSEQTKQYFIMFVAFSATAFALLLFSRRYSLKEQKRLIQHNEEIASREQQLDLLSLAFKNTSDAVWITDGDFNIQVVNKSYCLLNKTREENVIGKKVKFAEVEGQDGELANRIKASADRDMRWRGELYDQSKSGRIYPLELEVEAIFDDTDEISHYLGVFRDISEQRRAQEELLKLSTHDDLTKLPNAQLFREITERACVNYRSDKQAPVVIAFDIDDFKKINEAFSHDLGDKVIQHVAVTLASCLKERDVIAHVSGGEFHILLELSEPEFGAAVVANRIINLFEQAIEIEGNLLNLSVSMGISIFSSESGINATELIRQAALALFDVKSSGLNNFSFYEKVMNDEVESELATEQALLRGIENNEFIFYYQPVVNVVHNTIAGAEALIRWLPADGNMIFPDRFIPLAEKSGMIEKIDILVIDQVFKQIATWQGEGINFGPVSINLSAKMFAQPERLIQILSDKLTEYQIAPSRVKLEITESMLLTDLDAAIKTMNLIKSLGFTLVLDDFGTGFASLNYLKQFPIDILKIDRSFIMEMHESTTDQQIVKTIIELAHILNLSVVAEGVEIAEHKAQLGVMRCEEYQGYFFSKPVPVPDFVKLLNRQ
ncbi:EAL domain-containing protein [Catenovulum sp. SM1970]|uniref:EAL domain-containing protein n=1 Tax=Marinifaba aquimaris TaxID=2741323 RepID=UPI001574901D|nr:EAL domain-containing protein [Marinifaba aquimaris]NTS77094.1 EAL domain-containing protein [Marinifaba aquimaris]